MTSNPAPQTPAQYAARIRKLEPTSLNNLTGESGRQQALQLIEHLMTTTPLHLVERVEHTSPEPPKCECCARVNDDGCFIIRRLKYPNTVIEIRLVKGWGERLSVLTNPSDPHAIRTRVAITSYGLHLLEAHPDNPKSIKLMSRIQSVFSD